jgi:hypothetical protein
VICQKVSRPFPAAAGPAAGRPAHACQDIAITRKLLEDAGRHLARSHSKGRRCRSPGTASIQDVVYAGLAASSGRPPRARTARLSVRVASIAMAMKTSESVSAATVTWWATAKLTSCAGNQCTDP